MIINYNNAISANFKITFPRIQELEFYALSVNIPTVTLNAIEMSYQDTRAKVPDNKYLWDDLSVQFILDEDLYSYELISNWLKDVRDQRMWQTGLHDINIIPLDSNKNIEYSFLLEGAWPTNISGWQYTNANQVSEYIIFDVAFAYQNLKIKRLAPLNFRIVDAG